MDKFYMLIIKMGGNIWQQDINENGDIGNNNV